MEAFGAASHDEVLQLVIQVAALLVTARLLGGLAQRLGQPSVVGEILAGVVLGPSLLSGLVPFAGEWILPQTQTQGFLLEVVSLIGVMLLLIVTGLETDLGLIRRHIRVSLGVSAGGLLVTFGAGLALGFALPDDLLADPSQRTVFALFVATALAIAAIPVLAKVLLDLGLMRRDLGQTMLASGMIDDIVGWTLLGLVTALASADALTAGTVIQTVLVVIVFGIATVTVGRWLVDNGLTLVQNRLRGEDAVLTLVIVLAFAWGAFTQALYLEPVIGAFAIGILFGRLPRLPSDVVNKLESMALAVFAPIFFAVAGLKVDIVSILEPRLLGFTLAVIGVATFGKVTGAYLGARFLAGQDHWRALAFGSGLNARGALEIIIATIGLNLGILSSEMFSIIVVMAIVTSLMAPVALRFVLSRVELGEEEEKRLAKEEAQKGTFTRSIKRILVPVRPRPEIVGTQTIQALVSQRLAAANGTATMLLAVTDSSAKDLATEYLTRLDRVFDAPDTTSRIVTGKDPTAAILDEASHGYDLLMIGTPTMGEDNGNLFGPMLDDLVKLSPCPTVVVRGDTVNERWDPARIVVPTNGTPGARRAMDLALAIAGPDTEITAVHVVTPMLGGTRKDFAHDVTAEVAVVATKLDRRIETQVIEAIDVETGILEAVDDWNADLLVLGTSVRAGTTRLHLGPQVENLARYASCPVMILNS